MRELTYFVAVSLDGRIAAPDGDFSAFSMQGDHIDWIVREYPETLPGPALAALGVTPRNEHFDTVLMGWNTYAVGLPFDQTDPYPHLRQHVFSRRSRELPEGIVLSADPLGTVRALKAEQGTGIWLCGGGEIATELADEIDRLVLKVNPLLLGDGVPLFGGGYRPRGFELTASTAFDSGVVVNSYARA